MKTNIILLLFMFAIIKLQAQDYQINFSATGQSTSLDSIHVLNLTQNTSLSLNGSDVLHLVGTIGIQSIQSFDKSFKIYPNPMNETSSIEFYNNRNSIINIEVFNVLGKLILSTRKQLQQGIYTYEISGLKNGVYTINIYSSDFNYSKKLISINNNSNLPSLKYLNSYSLSIPKDNIKGSNNLIQMQYNDGEYLLFTSFSSIYETIVTILPTGNSTILFQLLSCTDGDNNNYPVVSIGSQTWMAENLKTTKFNNGNSIPLVTNSTSWNNLTSSGYCWYNNDISNMNIYGALYNWYTVGTSELCPIGWHVPSYIEWDTLINYLGDNSIAGATLKETGLIHWNSPNTGATNSSGFTAVGGGFRGNYGVFNSLLNSGLWWSSTETNSTEAMLTSLSSSTITCLTTNIQYKKYGFSIRCVED